MPTKLKKSDEDIHYRTTMFILIGLTVTYGEVLYTIKNFKLEKDLNFVCCLCYIQIHQHVSKI